ncbi:response regulator [Desulfosarcina alkanivorans]|jgi:DNA-binding NtrC family response regulator|uniref:Response regulator n=1 Tax=Desulfosarcina alkanivorans TaxID=571177 RepID=A0A5K7YYM2_9BACT|nr:response regulator [Desulfosarcina alkanivorans]BBO72251.1 response regulator [Desulfosarcina alkanivorans]
MTDFTVMLVDDEKDFLEPLAKRLEKRNLRVLKAGNGEAGLEMIRQTPVDLVLLDVRMPGMDGIEVLRAIKASDPTIEVVLLTGHASVEAAYEGIAQGAFDYLMKPVGIDELMFKLQDAYKARTISLKCNKQGASPDECNQKFQ